MHMKNIAIYFILICSISVTNTIGQQMRSTNISPMPPANNSPTYSNNNNSTSPSPVSSSNTSTLSQPPVDMGNRNNYPSNDTRTVSTGTVGYSSGAARIAPSVNYSNTNYSGTVAGNQPSGATGREMRYNYGSGHTYPYCSSVTTKYKSHKHCSDSVRINCPPPVPLEFYYGSSYSVPDLDDIYYYEYLYDYFTTFSEPDNIANTAEYVSFDGYMVYNKDTLTGIVTMNPESVYVEEAINQTYGNTYNAKYRDKYLKCITLFKGNKTLCLTRLADNDRQLWRIVHSGKLMIYDDNFSFLSFRNINHSGMRVKLPGETTYFDISSKKHLVWCINRAYNLNFHAKDYSWKELLWLIDKLD